MTALGAPEVGRAPAPHDPAAVAPLMTRYRGLAQALLPGPVHTAMLRAMLLDGDRGRAAWRAWESDHGGTRRILGEGRDGVKRLFPMLERSRARLHVDVEPLVATCLKTAYVREEVRSRTFRAYAGEALAALRAAGLRTIVLRGTALAEHEYGDPALRHCHDLDLLMADGAVDAAVIALRDAGWSPFRDTRGPAGRTSIVVHESGLPVHLHTRLFAVPWYGAARASICDRTVPRRVCGVDVDVLDPVGTMLHVLGHASMSVRRHTLGWATDACVLIESGALDWTRLETTTIAARFELPVALLLAHLRDEVGANVPARVVERLARAALDVEHATREAAIFGASASAPGAARTIWRHAGASERLDLAKWALLPHPAHVRWAYRLPHPWLVPFAYAYRPLRALARRLHRVTRPSEAPLPEFMAD